MTNPLTSERIHWMDLVLAGFVVLLCAIGHPGKAFALAFGYLITDTVLARQRAREGRSFK